MSEDFLVILNIAKENIANNPGLQKKSSKELVAQYMQGLHEELVEVEDEVKENNSIYLEDELSDIAWDYACLLAALEKGGFITNAEGVLSHGVTKYSERAPAFLKPGEEAWDSVKKTQKLELARRHQKKYGT